MRRPGAPSIALTVLLAAGFAIAGSAGIAQEPGELANPQPFTIDTIKRGRQHFTVHCVSCHGVDGRGDTEMREFLKTPPADLTDPEWVYGGGDAEMFDVIKQGRVERDMPGFAAQLSDDETWQVVSYMRYLGGRRP